MRAVPRFGPDEENIRIIGGPDKRFNQFDGHHSHAFSRIVPAENKSTWHTVARRPDWRD